MSATDIMSVDLPQSPNNLSTVTSTSSDDCNCCGDLHNTVASTDSLAPHSPAEYEAKIDDKESDAVAACYNGCAACCHTFQHKYCSHHSHSAPSSDCCKQHADPSSHTHNHTSKPCFLKLPTAAIKPFDIASPTHCIEAAAASAALSSTSSAASKPLPRLSWMDRLLSVWIIACMLLGILIGYFDPNAADNISSWGGGGADGTSIPIAVGLIVT